METIHLQREGLRVLRRMNPLLVSYNVEMAEVTGGTFWKEYTKAQIRGEEPYQAEESADSAMQVYDPVNLYENTLRTLAKALGPCYIRVSGSWCTTTYVDPDGETDGKIPEGYQNILTREQWIGVLDFVRAVEGKLLVSAANCEGNHRAHEPWDSRQMVRLLDFSRAYGVPVEAAEFTNEPNGYNMTGTPKGYSPEDFGRDQDSFFRLLQEDYPEITTVGPSANFDPIEDTPYAVYIQHEMFHAYSTETLMRAAAIRPEVFSYHLYYGLSERGAVFGGHWDADQALSEEYLNTAEKVFRYYEPIRDAFVPGGEIWITEEGDAACGGNTWAPTFLEAVRLADVFGRFSRHTNGIIFHNTLAASAYGFLDQRTHLPRPSYWIAWLWKHLMGDVVYDAGEPIREGAHVYAHSRRDGREGIACAVINNSLREKTRLLLPDNALVWEVTAPAPRSEQIFLNGKELLYDAENGFPSMEGKHVEAGEYFLPPVSIAFIIV